MPRGFAMYARRGLGGDGESGVHIEKAENGYLVTLVPALDPAGDFPYMMREPEPHQVEEMKAACEKSRSRVFVFTSLDDAWGAIKEFLLDGRLPKMH